MPSMPRHPPQITARMAAAVLGHGRWRAHCSIIASGSVRTETAWTVRGDPDDHPCRLRPLSSHTASPVGAKLLAAAQLSHRLGALRRAEAAQVQVQVLAALLDLGLLRL